MDSRNYDENPNLPLMQLLTASPTIPVYHKQLNIINTNKKKKCALRKKKRNDMFFMNMAYRQHFWPELSPYNMFLCGYMDHYKKSRIVSVESYGLSRSYLRKTFLECDHYPKFKNKILALWL